MDIKKKLNHLPGAVRLKQERDRLLYKKEEREKRRQFPERQWKLQGTRPLVSIIIVNRNGKSKLEILMRSLHRCQFYDKFEIVFVDNASTDDSVAYMETWQDKMKISVVRNTENRTFSEANNEGVRHADGEYYLFLNNDTQVTDGWLDELLKAASKEHVGAVGARLVYPRIPSGEKNADKSYKVQHAGIGFRDKTREKQYFIQPYNLENGRSGRYVDKGVVKRACVTAAVLLVSKEAFMAVGGFDEQYIYGYEDVDFCLKLLKAGYDNYYCGSCLVYHYEFGTQKADDETAVKQRRLHNMEVFKGKWQQYLFRTICQEKIISGHMFTRGRLTIAVAGGKRACLEPLEQRGYKVVYLDKEHGEWKYNLGVGIDVLLSFVEDYDITKITGCKNDVFTVACITQEWTNPVSPAFSHVLETEDFSDSDCDRVIDALKTWCKEEVNDKEIDILGAMPDNESTKFWGDYHYAEALKKEFEKRGYRANVRSREHWFDKSSAKYVLVLRGLKPYYPAKDEKRRYMMWNISHPADVPVSEYELFDYVFFASQHMKDCIKTAVPSGVLLQCTDAQVMSAKNNSETRYELLFVGNSRKVYRQILKDLLPTDYELTVYGRHWEEFPVQQYVKDAYLDNAKVGQAYHDAKILLNDHWEDMREYGIISNRIFDALAAGAFIISDEVKGMQDVLHGSVVTYKNREDLKEKIDYYMQHEEERKKKAEQGKELVLLNHTFANRVEQMLSIMKTL